jgi:hypothetical protein
LLVLPGLGSDTTYLIDLEGQVVHTWTTDLAADAGYLQDDGSLVRQARIAEPENFKAGGVSGYLQRVSWDGEVLRCHSRRSAQPRSRQTTRRSSDGTWRLSIRNPNRIGSQINPPRRAHKSVTKCLARRFRPTDGGWESKPPNPPSGLRLGHGASHEIEGSVRFQACNPQVCLFPASVPLTVAVVVTKPGQPANAR